MCPRVIVNLGDGLVMGRVREKCQASPVEDCMQRMRVSSVKKMVWSPDC